MARPGRRPGADIAVAAALAATGAAFWLYLYQNPIGRPLFGVASDTLPAALTGVIAIVSAALVVVLLVRPAPPAPAPAEATDGVAGFLRLLALIALCIGFSASLRHVGFLVAGGGLALGTALLFGKRQIVALAVLALAVPFGIAIFFEKAMVIYLPAGRLFQ